MAVHVRTVSGRHLDQDECEFGAVILADEVARIIAAGQLT